MSTKVSNFSNLTETERKTLRKLLRKCNRLGEHRDRKSRIEQIMEDDGAAVDSDDDSIAEDQEGRDFLDKVKKAWKESDAAGRARIMAALLNEDGDDDSDDSATEGVHEKATAVFVSAIVDADIGPIAPPSIGTNRRRAALAVQQQSREEFATLMEDLQPNVLESSGRKSSSGNVRRFVEQVI